MNYLMYIVDYGLNLMYVIWASLMACYDQHHTNVINPLKICI